MDRDFPFWPVDFFNVFLLIDKRLQIYIAEEVKNRKQVPFYTLFEPNEPTFITFYF